MTKRENNGSRAARKMRALQAAAFAPGPMVEELPAVNMLYGGQTHTRAVAESEKLKRMKLLVRKGAALKAWISGFDALLEFGGNLSESRLVELGSVIRFAARLATGYGQADDWARLRRMRPLARGSITASEARILDLVEGFLSGNLTVEQLIAELSKVGAEFEKLSPQIIEKARRENPRRKKAALAAELVIFCNWNYEPTPPRERRNEARERVADRLSKARKSLYAKSKTESE